MDSTQSEAQIAERLKQNITPSPSAVVQTPEESAPTGEPGYVADIGDALDIYKMYDFFNVESSFRNGENEEKLSRVYRWAALKAGTTDYLAVSKVIMQYEMQMGGSNMGSRLDRMYNYVKLDDQIGRLKQEQTWL